MHLGTHTHTHTHTHTPTPTHTHTHTHSHTLTKPDKHFQSTGYKKTGSEMTKETGNQPKKYKFIILSKKLN